MEEREEREETTSVTDEWEDSAMEKGFSETAFRFILVRFGRLLGLSRGAPERSWAALGYLLGFLGG